jgi:hypothetical protein
VRDPAGPDRECPDSKRARGDGLDIERRRAEARLTVQRVEPVVQSGRPDDADSRRLALEAQVVAECHQVDEMVRMQVADDDRIERFRRQEARQPRKRPLAEVQQEIRPVRPKEVRGPGRAKPIGVCRPRADHVQVHAV